MDGLPLSENTLLQAIGPRPLVWVTTRNAEDGTINIAPFSALTILCNEPAILLLVIQRRTDGSAKTTSRNILASHEFVLNVPVHRQLAGLMRSAAPEVAAQDRVAVSGVRFTPSRWLTTPRISGCHFAIECVLHRNDRLTPGAGADLFWGQIKSVHARQQDLTAAPRFLGALGFEWFVSEQGLHHIEQPYLQA